MSDMSVADEGASPDELLWEPLLFRVYQRSPEERRPVPSVQGGGDSHLAQQEGEVQDHRAQGGIGIQGQRMGRAKERERVKREGNNVGGRPRGMALKAHVSAHSCRIQSLHCESQCSAWASIK